MLVVGGGINGAGIARDAAGRGLSVRLVEKGDLAGATSSASSKLIHGGLRYLEYGALRLVREALSEREVLLANAPHIIAPLRFVLPHDGSLRPKLLLRLGLFLYDHLGGRRVLPGTETVQLSRHPYGVPLQGRLRTGFVYSDCWVDDARLVVLNARDAAARGAIISRATEMKSARRSDDHWVVRLVGADGEAEEVAVRVLVNAAGPWAADVLQRAGIRHASSALRLVKGSHIVVRRLYDGSQAYILQNDDRRVIFVIPFEGEFSLIGTTDVPFTGSRETVAIDPREVDYLCRAVSRWFARPVSPTDVVWSYAGVRPLYDDEEADASAVTRDYHLELDTRDKSAPLLSVFGGKLTTYRRLAEHALEKLARYFPACGKPWTAHAPLPGGDLPPGGVEAFADELLRQFPFLDRATTRRLARSYGTEARKFLAGAHRIDDLGKMFGCGFSERELDWLVREEWARTAEDVLWRRSKLGLHLNPRQAAEIADALAALRSARRSHLALT